MAVRGTPDGTHPRGLAGGACVHDIAGAMTTHAFQADVTRLLELVVHSLYSNKEIFLRELGRRVALDRQFQFRSAHPRAVVADTDQRQAAVGRDHLDLARTGIERVLDEFLHDAARTLDHFAGSDAIDCFRAELSDAHRRCLSWSQIADAEPWWTCRLPRQLRHPLARDDLGQFHGGLVEGIDIPQPGRENRLQHQVHHQSADRRLVKLGQFEDADGAPCLGQSLWKSGRLRLHEVAGGATGEVVEAGAGGEALVHARAGAAHRRAHEDVELVAVDIDDFEGVKVFDLPDFGATDGE